MLYASRAGLHGDVVQLVLMVFQLFLEPFLHLSELLLGVFFQHVPRYLLRDCVNLPVIDEAIDLDLLLEPLHALDVVNVLL